MVDLIILAVLGAIAGYFVGALFGKKGFGPFGNMAVGVAGAVLGGLLLAFLGGIIIKIFAAAVGALILFWALSKFRKTDPPKEAKPTSRTDKVINKHGKYFSD